MVDRKIIEGEDTRTDDEKLDDELQFRNKKLSELNFVIDNEKEFWRKGGFQISFHNVENLSDVDFDKKLAKFEAQNKPIQDENKDKVEQPKQTRAERRANARASHGK